MSVSEKLGLVTVLFGLWLATAYPANALAYGLYIALLGAIAFIGYRET